jgi:N-acetylmuramoyl-L-alanine amidase
MTTAVEPSATLPAVAAGSAPVVAKSIAYTKLPKGDRITLELSAEVPFTADLSAGADQLLVSLTGVVAPNPVVAAADTIRGTFVTSLALDRPSGGRTELDIRLKAGSRYSTYPLYDPYRLVVDFEAEPATTDRGAIQTPRPPAAPPSPTTVAAAPAHPASQPTTETADAPDPAPTPAPPASTSRGDFSLARQLGLGVSRIVIDPGHGGHDPGAQANGVSESELVLDVALRLEKLLAAQPGFEVVLTRRKNQFVALEERTAIANRETADLFLSIHANSSPNRDTRGIETYFLNFATNAAAEAVAARENASSAQAMHLLPELVQAIATSDKVAESRELATMVQTSLMRRVGALNKSIKDLGVKQAPFVVLIGAKMPSVLAEVSFLTNKTEASLLKQAAHRQRIAQALADAVLRYQASLKKVTGVSARSEGR